MKARAIIQYRDFSCVANIIGGEELARYYLSLVPRYHNFRPQKYEPHVTIVRNFEAPNFDRWFFRDGEEITINYGGKVVFEGLYACLKCWSAEIQDIRLHLGLTKYRKGFKSYHLTIGNKKCA